VGDNFNLSVEPTDSGSMANLELKKRLALAKALSATVGVNANASIEPGVANYGASPYAQLEYGPVSAGVAHNMNETVGRGWQQSGATNSANIGLGGEYGDMGGQASLMADDAGYKQAQLAARAKMLGGMLSANAQVGQYKDFKPQGYAGLRYSADF